MHKILMLAAAVLIASPAIAQQTAQPQVAPTEHIKVDLSMQELQTIGNALGKLPYENAAPILNSLSKQLDEYAKAKKADETKAATEKAEPPKDDKK